MLSEQEKKEMLQDALSKQRRMAFEAGEKKAKILVKKYLSSLTVDKVIKFLMDAQKITGPFPIPTTTPTPPYNFRL